MKKSAKKRKRAKLKSSISPKKEQKKQRHKLPIVEPKESVIRIKLKSGKRIRVRRVKMPDVTVRFFRSLVKGDYNEASRIPYHDIVFNIKRHVPMMDGHRRHQVMFGCRRVLGLPITVGMLMEAYHYRLQMPLDVNGRPITSRISV